MQSLAVLKLNKYIYLFWWIIFIGTIPSNVLAAANLPYRMLPLVQQGGDNIAPQISDDLKRWGLKGDVQYTEFAGKRCLRLGNTRNKELSGIKFSLNVSPNTLYSISFNYRFTQKTEFDYKANYPGLHGWIVVTNGSNEEVSSWRILEQRISDEFKQYRAYIYTTQSGENMKFKLYFNGVSGNALISDVIIQEEKITKDQNRMIISPPEGKTGYAYAEILNQEGSLLDEYSEGDNIAIQKLKTTQLSNGIIYHRDDLDKLFFYSKPLLNEINKPVTLSLTAGEIGITTLAVHALKDLSNLKIDVSDLKNKAGKSFSGNIEWKYVHYNPRRVDYYGRGRTWHWVADYFSELPEDGNTKTNTNTVFWIKINANPEAETGIYKGNIKVSDSKGEIGFITFEIKIRPFKLIELSNKSIGIYPDIGRWKKLNDDNILKELEDFKEHGIRHMFVPSGRPLIQNEKIIGWQFNKQDKHYMNLILESKMQSPFIVWFGWLDKWLGNFYKIKLVDLNKNPSQWPLKVKEAYKNCLIFFKNEFEKNGWGEAVFHAVDEPGYWKTGSPEHFIWKYKTAIDVGLKTYSTSNYLPNDFLGKNITYHTYGKGILINPERTNFVREQTHKNNQKFWYYATGSYTGQIGKLVKNRYLSGFIFFRSGADGIMSWTFQRPHGNAIDDFYSGKNSQPYITFPDPEHPGEYLDTPHWEGLRQGWIDFKYLSTLAEIAKRSTEAMKEMERIIDSMPWNGDVFLDNDVTNSMLDKWREEISNAIDKFSSQ